MAILDEEPTHEMMILDEDLLLKDEDITKMVESLKINDACLNESIQDKKNMRVDQQDENKDTEIIQINGHEKDLENIIDMQHDDEMEEVNSDLASVGDNYTEYNWFFEDEMKTWEWSEYTCTHPI